MKNKTTQGLGNKNVLSFPKHDSLRCWRLKRNVNSHISIQYVNLDHFPICQEANGVSKKSKCADSMKLYTAENCTSNYQTHVTGAIKGQHDNWMVSLASFWPGVGIYIFNWYLRLVFWLFNGWIRRKTFFSLVPFPTINNEMYPITYDNKGI